MSRRKYLTVTGTLHHGMELWETVRSGLHQVIVNGEAADVETARGDIVTGAALSHIYHSWGNVSNLKCIKCDFSGTLFPFKMR